MNTFVKMTDTYHYILKRVSCTNPDCGNKKTKIIIISHSIQHRTSRRVSALEQYESVDVWLGNK